MSSGSEPDIAQTIKDYQTIFTLNCVQFAGQSLLGYQWLTTLDKEVLLFWKRRFTGASALFFSIRYSALISYGILSFITYAPLSDSSCAMLVRAQATLVMFQYLPWAAFAALRVLALSGMRWTLAAIVLVLSLGAPVVNFMQWGYNLTGINVPLVGCSSSVSASAQTHLIFTAVSRSTLIAADIVVVVVTIWSIRRKGLHRPQRESRRLSLGEVLLYDGLLYFVTITCFNIIDLVTTIISLTTPYDQGSYITALSDPVTAILLARFLLDLQSTNLASRGTSFSGTFDLAFSSDSAPAGGASMVFARAPRALGSLGATLGPGSSTFGGETEYDGEDGFGLDTLKEPEPGPWPELGQWAAQGVDDVGVGGGAITARGAGETPPPAGLSGDLRVFTAERRAGVWVGDMTT